MRGSDLYFLSQISGTVAIMTKLLDIMLFMRSWHLVSSTKIAWIIQGKTFKQNNVQPDLLLEFGLIVSFQPERWKKGTCPCVPLALVAAPSCHNVWCCKPCPKIRCLAQVALSRAPTNPQCRGGFELGMVLCHNPLHCTETDKDRPTHPHGKIRLGMFLKPLKLRHNPYHLLSD